MLKALAIGNIGKAALLALFGTASVAFAQAPLQEIVSRVEQVQSDARNSIRPYSVTREYKLLKEGGQQDSKVVAEVNFVPPHKKDYQIQSTAGSGQGPKVVKKVLEHESEMTERWSETAIVSDNYDFAFLGEESLRGRNCYLLQLTPKRESKELISGHAWVDAETYRVLKVSGTPSKSPSWWIKRVQITVEYGDVQGMWLQRSTSAQADVRVLGLRTLVSRDVSYRTGEVVADNALPSRARSPRPATSLAAGVN